MKCPSCSAALTKVSAGDCELDVCQSGCGGVWFDRNELFKFDENHEFDPTTLLQIAKEKESVKVDSKKQKSCPTCTGQSLVRQFFDIKREVEFDQCWDCGGVWLDVGEINTVRGQFETHADRTKVANEYVVSELKKTHAALEEVTRQKLQALNQRYKWNPLARAIGMFQVMTGAESKAAAIMAEQIFKPDFDKLLK